MESELPRPPGWGNGSYVEFRGKRGYFYWPEEVNSHLARTVWSRPEDEDDLWGFLYYEHIDHRQAVERIGACQTQQEYVNLPYINERDYDCVDVNLTTLLVIQPSGGKKTRRGKRRRKYASSSAVFPLSLYPIEEAVDA